MAKSGVRKVTHPFTGKEHAVSSKTGKRILAYLAGTEAMCDREDMSRCSPGQKCNYRTYSCYTPVRSMRRTRTPKRISGTLARKYPGGKCPSGYRSNVRGRCVKSKRKSSGRKRRTPKPKKTPKYRLKRKSSSGRCPSGYVASKRKGLCKKSRRKSSGRKRKTPKRKATPKYHLKKQSSSGRCPSGYVASKRKGLCRKSKRKSSGRKRRRS